MLNKLKKMKPLKNGRVLKISDSTSALTVIMKYRQKCKKIHINMLTW